MQKRLYKNDKDGQIMGVCQGIAEYFDVDPSLVRIGFVLSVLLLGFGIIFYIVLGIILPEKEQIIKQKQENPEIYDSFDDY